MGGAARARILGAFHTMKSPKSFPLRTASLALLAAAAFAPSLCAQTLLLHYTFDDPQNATTTANAAGAGMTGTFYNSAGVATNLHSAPGAGVGGGYAFDNTSSTAMGSAGTGGKLMAANTGVFSGLTQFTVTGWYNAAAATGSSGARLFSTNDGKAALFFANPTGLTLEVRGAGQASNLSVASTNGTFSAVNQWVFFAVTYNGSLTSSNVRFYSGSDLITGSAVTAGSGTANAGTLDVTSTTFNLAGRGATNYDRPFDGLMDDFRVYSGVLDVAAIEAVRLDGVTSTIPEPSSAALLVGAGSLLFVAGGRRRRSAR